MERVWEGKLRSKLLEVAVKELGVDSLVTTITPVLYLFGLIGRWMDHYSQTTIHKPEQGDVL